MKSINKLRSNKGFTLIEVLVVIALIAVTVGIAATVSMSSSQVRKASHSADSMLSRCRINSLYRAEPVFVEFRNRGGSIIARYYERNEDNTGWRFEEEFIGGANVTMTYRLEGDAACRSLPLRISFVRGRGSLILLNDDDDATERTGELLDEIRFTDGALTHIIEITPATGHRNVRAGAGCACCAD
jgi:prepilin-type N-terminal cleavage/methylation domain-containing protein